jgi:small-conductance mechanosensitive channel
MEVRFWIEDAANGIANVTSDVLLKIWDAFHEHGIEIPYPQRDLHIRSPKALVDKLGQIG